MKGVEYHYKSYLGLNMDNPNGITDFSQVYVNSFSAVVVVIEVTMRKYHDFDSKSH